MAETAGLVLGAIPLVFLALDKYRECLESGKSFIKYENTLMTISDGVEIQRMQFHDTMEMIGLDKPTYTELDDFLRERFPDNHPIFMRCIREMATTIDQLMAKLEVDARGKSNTISSRAGWEWRRVKRSLSTKERKKIFDELQRSNTILRSLLPKPEIPVKDMEKIVQKFVARYNENSCDAVRNQASDVKKALDSCWQCTCTHRTSLELNWYAKRPTESPVFSVSLSYSTISSQNPACNSQWRKARVKVDNSNKATSSGSSEQVLGPSTADMGLLAVPPAPSSATKQRARSLLPHLRSRSRSTSPLPPSLDDSVVHIPLNNSVKQIDSLCQFVQGLDKGGEPLAYLSVPGGTKRVHLEASSGAQITEETRLLQLLPPNKPPAHLRLSRRERLEIAAAAVWTTLLLCETPWLNHTWDKHGLCFLSEDVSASGLPLANRCVSLTQSYGPNPLPTRTVGADPQKKLIPNEAIFALGILLIELSLNKSFEECKRTRDTDIHTTSVVSDCDIAESLIDDIFLEVGGPYADAVRICINFAFPGRDAIRNFGHATFRQYFHENVVAPIEATLSTQLA